MSNKESLARCLNQDLVQGFIARHKLKSRPLSFAVPLSAALTANISVVFLSDGTLLHIFIRTRQINARFKGANTGYVS